MTMNQRSTTPHVDQLDDIDPNEDGADTIRIDTAHIAATLAIGLAAFAAAIALAIAGITWAARTARAGEPPVEPDIDAVGLEALRYCESTNRYDIDTGNGYYGAYQFDQPTWDATMGWMADAGHLDTNWRPWIGVRPSAAPHWVQDNAAKWLWDNDPEHARANQTGDDTIRTGRRRWPNCQWNALGAMAETPDKRVAGIPPAPGGITFTG